MKASILINEHGFTLVELLVVLSIIAILVTIVAPGLTGITGEARSKAARTELKTVQSALDTLMVQTGAITVSGYFASGGVAVGPSTVITCYRHDGTAMGVPIGRYFWRLRTTSTGKYTWDIEGFVRQVSY
jgi:prepilin-type N-terminal cleavage/methylation domain-containing protein